ncbi:hypothetical protein [Heyndrickxia camelliae]|uniref:Uncharacterized protein n=1 Tax=Heyndrickxia camelliae TaxID=1707093 RepID=A0A2N3LE83_9BACI|nr:hypothetical protein [Heyndrickxia camelliae]PKR82844.1 hypothetical protein CWO92_21885 [Heyndrickxia camelliae]
MVSENGLSFSAKFIKNNVKESVIKHYEKQSVVRSLIQLIPFGAMLDTYVTSTFNNILIERSRTFFDELGTGKFILTPELIENEDFLHAFFSTYKNAIYTRQRAKIRFFARLLINSFEISSINEFEDYLKILDELTYREIYILYTLYEFEHEICSSIFGNDRSYIKLINSHKYWNNFTNKITSDLNITSVEMPGLIHRLSRTGCYLEFTGLAYSDKDGSGYTTEVFDKLVKLIEMKREDLSDIENINII